MIVLDTNVLSALMRTEPDPPVIAWLDRQPAESVWLTSITVFEVRFGMSILAGRRRRRALEAAFKHLLEEEFENRIVDFDAAAAEAAASIAAERHNKGRPSDLRDTLIAGIVSARRGILATRNMRHFDDLAMTVVNPWDYRK